MPFRCGKLSPTEVQLAREACAPLLATVTDRLLRGGFAAFVLFRHRYTRECRRAMGGSAGKPGAAPTATQVAKPIVAANASSILFSVPRKPTAEQTQNATAAAAAAAAAASAASKALRINPEGLKDVFAQSGLLLSPEDYRSILVAYSDAVGFVLAEDLLADLHPCQHAPLDLIHICAAAVAEGLFSELPVLPRGAGKKTGASSVTSGAADTDLPAVTVESVAAALSAVLATSQADDGAADVLSDLAALQAAVRATFNETVYQDGTVPAEDVVTFVVLSMQQHPTTKAVVLHRLPQCPPLVPAVSSSSCMGGAAFSSSTAPGMRGTGLDGTALFSIRHDGCRSQKKFQHYVAEEDRRDEWIRGRPESDARPMYMKHAVGYGGHLPEYQYRFGRTFHAIEEDLPQLTKPKPALEPVPKDWYGEGVELKVNRMGAHHFKLA